MQDAHTRAMRWEEAALLPAMQREKNTLLAGLKQTEKLKAARISRSVTPGSEKTARPVIRGALHHILRT